MEITNTNNNTDTVLPAKTDSDVMFYLQSYQGIRVDKYYIWSYKRVNFPQSILHTIFLCDRISIHIQKDINSYQIWYQFISNRISTHI